MKARLLTFLFALCVLALALPVQAQTVQTFVLNYDLNATTYTYCSTSAEATGPSTIKTASNTTATTAASGNPFGVVAAGDIISAVIGGVKTTRSIATYTSDVSIAVNSAWNLSANGASGYAWKYTHRTCGTTITSGWLSASQYNDKLIKIDANAMTGTGGIDYSIECEVGGNGGLTPAQLYSGNFTDTTVPTNSFTIVVPEPCSNVRVGLKWHTADTAGTDDITVVMQGTVQN